MMVVALGQRARRAEAVAHSIGLQIQPVLAKPARFPREASLLLHRTYTYACNQFWKKFVTA